jgi:hypothetical protein
MKLLNIFKNRKVRNEKKILILSLNYDEQYEKIERYLKNIISNMDYLKSLIFVSYNESKSAHGLTSSAKTYIEYFSAKIPEIKDLKIIFLHNIFDIFYFPNYSTNDDYFRAFLYYKNIIIEDIFINYGIYENISKNIRINKISNKNEYRKFNNNLNFMMQNNYRVSLDYYEGKYNILEYLNSFKN